MVQIYSSGQPDILINSAWHAARLVRHKKGVGGGLKPLPKNNKTHETL